MACCQKLPRAGLVAATSHVGFASFAEVERTLHVAAAGQRRVAVAESDRHSRIAVARLEPVARGTMFDPTENLTKLCSWCY